MYLIKRILVFLFLITTINAVYSQGKKSNCYSLYFADYLLSNFSKDFSKDTIIYLHIDSNIVKVLTVYTDSIRVDISTKETKDNCMLSGCISQSNGTVFYNIYYPIPLVNNSLFRNAIYRDDDNGFKFLVSGIGLTRYSQQKSKILKSDKKGYYILSFDGKYINYAFLEEKDGDLYTKYDPLGEGNGSTVTIKRKKLQNCISQETDTNKNRVISIGKIGNVYVVKSFYS